MKPIMRVVCAMMALAVLPTEVLAQDFRGLCFFRAHSERPNMMCASAGFSDENGLGIVCNPDHAFFTRAKQASRQ